MTKQRVILINQHNKKIGLSEKLKAHQQGKLHRAFSILIFNHHGKLLLQQRAKNKYHSGGLWSNTVCGHPKPNETYYQATQRRLREEMGFVCPLKKSFCLTYNLALPNGLTEHEYNCVFIGQYNQTPILNSKEVMSYAWVSLSQLKKELKTKPSKYTPWLKLILKKITH